MSGTSQSLSGDIISIHFDDNRKRQGLTCKTDPKGEVEEAGLVDDKSRKGSIDTRIINLVNQINNMPMPLSSPIPREDASVTSSSSEITNESLYLSSKRSEPWNYFTTSSCSGRAILFTHDVDGEVVVTDAPRAEGDPEGEFHLAVTEESIPQIRKANQKKGCKWLYVTHDEIKSDEFMVCWRNLPEGSYAVFKIEPSIFHVQCRSLSSAKELIQIAATQSGFRNSGMVIGKHGKITVAVRSTIGLEVPLPVGKREHQPIVSDQFLEYLINTGNETMRQNWERTEKFSREFQKHFLAK